MDATWLLRDRKTGEMVAEPIYGEKWLRWAYGHPLGKLGTWAVAKRAWFSRWYGERMKAPKTAALIAGFIEAYGLDAEEFVEKVEMFKSFNDFFVRKLKPEARPIAEGDGVFVFPADGRHRLLPCLDETTELWAKGEVFSVEQFLGSSALAEEFAGGSALVSRLAPIDYHRFHFPVGGSAGNSRLIDGPLYSVHPIALKEQTRFLVANKRMVTEVETPDFGRVVMVEIGATNVGSIRQTYAGGSQIARGEEKGYFEFGGSCVVTLLRRGTIDWDHDLSLAAAEWVEVYARMGERAGMAKAL